MAGPNVNHHVFLTCLYRGIRRGKKFVLGFGSSRLPSLVWRLTAPESQKLFLCNSNEFTWNLQWFGRHSSSPKSPRPTLLPSAELISPASVWSGGLQRITGNFQALQRTNHTWGLLPTLPTVLTVHKIQMKADILPFPPSFGMKLPTFCHCCSTCSMWASVSKYEICDSGSWACKGTTFVGVAAHSEASQSHNKVRSQETSAIRMGKSTSLLLT